MGIAYIREIDSCCKLHFNVGLFNSIIWELCTDNPWLLAVFHSRAERSSAHSSSNTGLSNLKRLMSQLSSFANRSSPSLTPSHVSYYHFRCLLTRPRLPLLMPFFSSLCACFYIHPCDCKHVCVNCPSMCLWCAHYYEDFHIINSFPASPLSVAKETIAAETCVRQPWSWRGVLHISTVISLLIRLNVAEESDVRHVFVHTQHWYMRPQELSFHPNELSSDLPALLILLYAAATLTAPPLLSTSQQQRPVRLSLLRVWAHSVNLSRCLE